MAYFSGMGVHTDGFQAAHGQRVHVQLLAPGNEIEMEPNSARSRSFTGSARPAQCGARNRSAPCQIRSLELKGALNWRGPFKVGWRF